MVSVLGGHGLVFVLRSGEICTFDVAEDDCNVNSDLVQLLSFLKKKKQSYNMQSFFLIKIEKNKEIKEKGNSGK